ncbi:hypothetical protein BV898_00406 [Hypsibius exemplaris]|uniref:Uncharacterized protein n=1 Tax=Hypsibius exemplaris TaxID=2072580 RepID=A0A1W0XDA8_HYPEX|nr:hypothetical protein BV898_00406 [Hypsibius exemplaris]
MNSCFVSILFVVALVVVSVPTGVVAAGPAGPALVEWQSCRWIGTSPFCTDSCVAGEQEVEKSTCGEGACCWTGYKLKCCIPKGQIIAAG